jgi:hypothetical protein
MTSPPRSGHTRCLGDRQRSRVSLKERAKALEEDRQRLVTVFQEIAKDLDAMR